LIEITQEEYAKIKTIRNNLTDGYGRINEIINGKETIDKLTKNKIKEPEINMYHYTSIDALKSILENETIRLTNAKYLNDSAEIMYTLDLILDVSEKVKAHFLIKKPEVPSEKGYNIMQQFDYFDKKVELLRQKMKSSLDHLYILSTSTNNDSLMLWSYYAQFDGYNIGFNKNELEGKLLSKQFCFINNSNTNVERNDYFTYFFNKKIYDRTSQENIIYQYLKILLEDFCVPFYDSHDYIINGTLWGENYPINGYIDNSIVLSMAVQIGEIAIFLKNPKYYHEEEYRLAFIALENKENNNDNNRDLIKYRQYKGVYIPYIEIIFKTDKDIKKRCLPIESIAIGPKNNINIAEDGLISMLSTLNYDISTIKVDTSKIPLRY
jgi:hypothetical protein